MRNDDQQEINIDSLTVVTIGTMIATTIINITEFEEKFSAPINGVILGAFMSNMFRYYDIETKTKLLFAGTGAFLTALTTYCQSNLSRQPDPTSDAEMTLLYYLAAMATEYKTGVFRRAFNLIAMAGNTTSLAAQSIYRPIINSYQRAMGEEELGDIELGDFAIEEDEKIEAIRLTIEDIVREKVTSHLNNLTQRRTPSSRAANAAAQPLHGEEEKSSGLGQNF
ncbi:MAG: hypothetical protein K0R25_373 [Rickettsiaceae bacterium]|jgi:hypothetical protein|nr:hypothetical protein [Rickettsiaceae bacterium]